ncbi:MAG TPA: hypothetical protein VGM27_08425 [Acidobacteriaceae bacterium]|jgi:uncharacterized protein YjgD (DUF1641 family)
MAVAVDFREFQPADSREDLTRRVREAPAEHAQAILAAYDLLQQLHDKDVFSLLNGLLGASDTVISQVVDVVSSKEMIRVLRILLIFGNVLKSIDPDKLSALFADTENREASLLSIGKQATSKDARRAMATAVGLLNLLGDALEKQHPGDKS